MNTPSIRIVGNLYGKRRRGGRGAAYNTHTAEKVFRDFIVKHIEWGGRGAVYMNIH